MLGENHSIHSEFPNQHDLIEKLMADNMHFNKLVHQHDDLDKKIRGIESRNSPIGDDEMHAFKHTRSQLKDEIYAMLIKAQSEVTS